MDTISAGEDVTKLITHAREELDRLNHDIDNLEKCRDQGSSAFMPYLTAIRKQRDQKQKLIEKLNLQLPEH